MKKIIITLALSLALATSTVAQIPPPSDPEGLQALRDLIDRGASVKGASPYIQLLLEPAEDA